MHRRSLPMQLRPNNGKGSTLSSTKIKKGGLSVVQLMLGVFFVCCVIMMAAISSFHKVGKTGMKHESLRATELLAGRNASNAVSSAAKSKEPQYYMVFSTGCSTFQDWQSYAFFFFALKVKQPGQVIRIASGCDEEKAKVLKNLHEKQIKTMSDRFHLHLTPDFSGPTNYKYYNKPFGIRHFMEKYLGYPDKNDDDGNIIMILDPDQMLLRPMYHDFTNTNIAFYKPDPNTNHRKTKVEHGHPFAALYGFGDQPFRKVDLGIVAGNNSLVHHVSKADQENRYPAGPPYIATVRDMYKISVAWTDFVPKVHSQYPHLLGEMFAYSLAAAHLGLPHHIAKTLMVSDAHANSNTEGWSVLESTPVEDICTPLDPNTLPSVLHYCQNYWMGKWFFGKYRLHEKFLSCEAPLLMEPPKDIGLKYDFFIKPGGRPYGVRVPLKNAAVMKRGAFMLCNMISGMNDVATYFKHHHCDIQTANFEKVYVFHRNMDPNITNYTNYDEHVFSEPYEHLK